MNSGPLATTSTPAQPGRNERARRRGPWPLIGPAFIAAVAYIDPGNIATNSTAGALYGTTLLWVIVMASAMGILVQHLSAKVGLVTGRSLAELSRDRPRPVRILLWLQAELVVVMTDLAEFVGGALALHLLFGVPVLGGALTMAALSMALLAARVRGREVFRGVVVSMFAVFVLLTLWQAARSGVGPGEAGGGLLPRLEDSESVFLAAGIVGATVMPHAVYLHSDLTARWARRQPRGDVRPALARCRTDVMVAMVLAALANAAILLAAASLPAAAGVSIPHVFDGYAERAGQLAAVVFALGLLISGLASSLVGVFSGQVIMQGFLRRRIPILVRRAVSAGVPCLVLLTGVDPTDALLLSQVVLSFALPFALVPLIRVSASRRSMGTYVNRRLLTVAAACTAGVVISLNAAVLALSVL